MITIELHTDDISSYGNLTEEQYSDIVWLAETSEDTYGPIHIIIEALKKAFEDEE